MFLPSQFGTSLDGALDTAETGRVGHHPQRLADRVGSVAPPRTSKDSMAPNPFICRAGQCVPGIVGQTGIPDALDRRMVSRPGS